MTLIDRRPRPRLRAARHRRAPTTASASTARRPSWSSPATTAPTRSPGTTGCSPSRATTPTAACASSLVNPNDAERYPRDSLEAMRERVAARGTWPMPYLRDETRRSPAPTARRRRPTCSSSTPTARCATAARRTPTTATRRCDAGVAARRARRRARRREPGAPETEPVGCSVKWKRVSLSRRFASALLVLQLALEDLAGGVARELVDELDVARHLVAREVLLDVVLERRPRDSFVPLALDDERLQPLAELLVGHADDGDLGDRRVAWRAGPRPPAGRRSRRPRRSCRRRGRRRTGARPRRSGPTSPVAISPSMTSLPPPPV